MIPWDVEGGTELLFFHHMVFIYLACFFFWGGNWIVVSFLWHVFDMVLIIFVLFFCKSKPKDAQITLSELVVFGKIMCKFIMIWKHPTKNQDLQGPSDIIIPPKKHAASFSIPVLPGGIIFGNLGSFNLPGRSISFDHYSAMVWNHEDFVRFSISTGSLGFFVYWDNGITDNQWSSHIEHEMIWNTRCLQVSSFLGSKVLGLKSLSSWWF